MSLVRGDAIALPLADESVDLIVTSPPYFALRSYTDGGEHYDGQIGSEATPAEFLAALWAVTAECKRVLKPSGSMFVNLGDKYSGAQAQNTKARAGDDSARTWQQTDPRRTGIPNKSLMGLPWRYAIGCIDDLDLILRAEVVWSKPNGLPESVTDRVRRSHEQWFMFTKSPRYYSAVDEIRESRGDVVEAPPKHLPGCPLFRGPSDALPSPGVGGGHEPVSRVQHLDLADEVGADQRVQDQHITGAEQEHEVRASRTPVPLLVGGHADGGADAPHLLDDGVVAAVDGKPEMGRLGAAVAQCDGALPVDDSGEPGKVCTCGHNTYHSTGLGKLPGSVWTIPSEPLSVPTFVDGQPWGSRPVWGDSDGLRRLWRYAETRHAAGQPCDVWSIDHFAAFPQEWPRRLILGWSPPGICVECGEGRRPVVDVKYAPAAARGGDGSINRNRPERMDATTAMKTLPVLDKHTSITGYACACPTPDAPTRPAVVLDPFGGTGTVAMVARALGRYGVHVDLSADYLRLASWRIFDSGHANKTTARTARERQTEMFGDAA